MRLALAFKAHSGWAAAVAIGALGDELVLVDRRRVELVDDRASWLLKQPYHAAEDLAPDEAEAVVQRGIESANHNALSQLGSLVKELSLNGHEIAACAVLVPSPMPDWTTREILSVHFRMHKAEGVLYPKALSKAAEAHHLHLVEIPEKQLDERSAVAFGPNRQRIMETLAGLGKAAGPPWTKDQKTAALGAVIALRTPIDESRQPSKRASA